MLNKIAYKFRDFFRGIMDIVHHYVLEMIILGFMMLGVCWAIGYFANAVYGMHFELQSCWGGFQAIGGAGVLAAIKYCTDSWKNSPEGEAPTQYYSRKMNDAIQKYLREQPNDAKASIMEHNQKLHEKEGFDDLNPNK